MLKKFRKLMPTARYALNSFPDFSGAAREAADLFFYREFLHSSPIPQASRGLLETLSTYEAILPPKAFLGDGTQSMEGLLFLVSLAKALHARRVFEIGTFTGVTALTLAMNLPDLTVHTLDLPAGNLPSLNVGRDDKGYIPAQRRRRVFEDRPEAARITQLEGDSARFDFSPWGSSCDLVYIDGAHSYDYVASDTERAFALVNGPAAAIVWDDYGPGWPGVVRNLNERRDIHLYRVPDTRLILWLGNEAESALNANAQIL